MKMRGTSTSATPVTLTSAKLPDGHELQLTIRFVATRVNCDVGDAGGASWIWHVQARTIDGALTLTNTRLDKLPDDEDVNGDGGELKADLGVDGLNPTVTFTGVNAREYDLVGVVEKKLKVRHGLSEEA